jgi:hypothetical protein
MQSPSNATFKGFRNHDVVLGTRPAPGSKDLRTCRFNRHCWIARQMYMAAAIDINAWNMALLTLSHVAIGVARESAINRCHGGNLQLRCRAAHLLQEQLLLKRRGRFHSAASQKHREQEKRFHRIDSRPTGREGSIAYPGSAVQNGVTV